MSKKLVMRYFLPAENSDTGWEQYSLPIGNGYFGASVFGGTDTERIQFTTNTFANPYDQGGVSNFGEILINFDVSNISNYERGLSLEDGTVYSTYVFDKAKIKRTAFVSYPDKVFAYKIDVKNGTVNFDTQLVIPYLNARSVEDGGRTGEITVDNNVLVMRGTLPSRELIYEARLSLITDGILTANGNSLSVKNATSAEIFYTLDTSYKLCPQVFKEGYHKALGDDPHCEVVNRLNNALAMGWGNLYKRHFSDYTSLISRVSFDLGGLDNGSSIEELLKSYQSGNFEPYLEELYFAYGRHLLVSSSRKGTPPASLQGVWTVHDKSPWSCGFWHNINLQMNYWPTFNTNLAETFLAYADYWKNYVEAAEVSASNWVKEMSPENYVDGKGECGWIIGTGAWMYQVEGMNKYTHSGPGTGGMTSKMFWDYFDFTRDKNVLTEYSQPAIHGMAKFLTKCVKNYDGRYLCNFSASPEQILSGNWVHTHQNQQYYLTVGCAFDQQFIYQNATDDLKCADLLDFSDNTTETEKKQLSGYDPIQIGYNGQIKEYEEENFYGEIGEANHRHISQLVALTPGNIVTHSTPAWLDAAKLTLEMRGDKSTGWALAHRLNAWARVGDGNHAYMLLQNLLRERTYPNLWDVHPPFQIDGNFGATAGIAEMLLQSHEGYISLLPAIPDCWKNLSFKGLKARGNFTVDCDYYDSKIQYCRIISGSGETLKLRYEGMKNIKVFCNGNEVDFKQDGFYITFKTEKDFCYILKDFETVEKRDTVSNLNSKYYQNGVLLTWNYDKSGMFEIWRSEKNDSDYKLIAQTDKTQFTDCDFNCQKRSRLTYKIIVANQYQPDSTATGVLTTLHPATQLEEDRYNLKFKVVNKIL